MRLVVVAGPPRPVRPDPAADPAEAELGRICDDLLTALGGAWDDPPAPPAGWHTDPGLDGLRDRARAVLDRLADGYVWEDPRAGLLLPFWDDVAQVAATAVVVFDPDDVIHHLVDETSLTVEQAADLWLHYTLTAWADAPTRVPFVPRSEPAPPSGPEGGASGVAAGTTSRAGSPHGDPPYQPEHALGRIAELVDDCYDDARTREAIARCMGTRVDEHLAPARTVGEVVGGERLALAHAVHALLSSDDEDVPGELVSTLRDGILADRRTGRLRRDLDAALRAQQEDLSRAHRLREQLEALREHAREVEQRFAGAARDARIGEEELARQNQQLQAQLHRLQSELTDLSREHDRLRRKRSVRLALALEDVAKPAVKRLRGRTKAGPDVGKGADEQTPGRERPPAKVFTVVLNYRHADDTLRCVGSLEHSTDRNQFLVVVDNGSGREVVDRLRQGLHSRTLIEAGENLGYAAGNNLGIRHALEHDADFVWILNPDARVEPDTLARLLDTMADEPDCGILGARVLNGESDPVTIETDGGIVDRRIDGATSHRNVGRPRDEVAAGPPHHVDYVPGSCMLIRRAVFETVGLLPEEWFLYFEETDFNLRVADYGWRVMVDPRAVVWHHKRSSGRVPSPYYVYYFVRNRYRFARRWADAGGVPNDLQGWIDAWRERTARADPDWIGTFDDLVERALDDAKAGVTGRREDIEKVEPSELGRG